jgi:hypothetical protein
MRRRLPTPALIIASIALFAALSGAGFAAARTLVAAPKASTLVYGRMSANGKLVGSWSRGTEKSTGVYTLTINGNTFAPNKAFAPGQVVVSPQVITISGSGFAQKVPPTCAVATETIASNGSERAEVDCFRYDAATGWVPADAGFDFQVVGPTP